MSPSPFASTLLPQPFTCSARYVIPLDRDHVVGHEELATDKRDPGIALGTFPIDELISESRTLRFGLDRDALGAEVASAHEALGRALELLG